MLIIRNGFDYRMRSSNVILQLPTRAVRRQVHYHPRARQQHQTACPSSALHPLSAANRPRFHCCPVQTVFPRRHESTTAVSSSPKSERRRAAATREEPAFEMTFTCKRCTTRSTHRVSKQSYFHGTILITCSGCKNRHLISDHLGIFSDKAVTLEDLMREKGHMLKKGTLSVEGDVEFWDDGTTRRRLELGVEKVVEHEVAARRAAAAKAEDGNTRNTPGASFGSDKA